MRKVLAWTPGLRPPGTSARSVRFRSMQDFFFAVKLRSAPCKNYHLRLKQLGEADFCVRGREACACATTSSRPRLRLQTISALILLSVEPRLIASERWIDISLKSRVTRIAISLQHQMESQRSITATCLTFSRWPSMPTSLAQPLSCSTAKREGASAILS